MRSRPTIHQIHIPPSSIMPCMVSPCPMLSGHQLGHYVRRRLTRYHSTGCIFPAREGSRAVKSSEVAKAAGVNLQTLRYYERRGLVPEPDRRPSGYREYESSTVQRVRFIKRAQQLGFTLEEIAELLALRQVARRARPRAQALAVAKIATVDEKLRQLGAMRSALTQLIEACACEPGSAECPIIEALEEGESAAVDGRHGEQ